MKSGYVQGGGHWLEPVGGARVEAPFAPVLAKA